MRRLPFLVAGLIAASAAVTIGGAPPAQADIRSTTSAGPITIPGVGSAAPYPATAGVSGLGGPISDVNVTLNDLDHGAVRDLDIVLRSPRGTLVTLLSDACTANVTSDDITIDDEAAQTAEGVNCNNGGVFRPTNVGPGDNIPVVGAIPSNNLAAFDGENANGQWQLFVQDDLVGFAGSMSSFTVTITTEPADISIADGAGAPFVIPVSGQPGAVKDVDLQLKLISHTFPDDLDMLLVSPAGQSVLLVSDACGGADIHEVDWAFDDGGPALPDNGPCVSGTFRPSNFGAGADTFAAPAPAGPFGDTLSDLDGGVANGTWRLFVTDDAGVDTGYITDVALTVTSTALPDTVVTKKPKKVTKKRKATIRFFSTKDDSTFRCKVDNKKWKPCSSPLKLKKVKPGKHKVLIRATDNGGQVESKPAKVKWRVRR